MKIGLSKTLSVVMAVTLAWLLSGCTKQKDVTVAARSNQPGSIIEEKKSPEEIVRECQNNLINLDAAVDRYRVTHYKKYPGSLRELAPDYINYIPSCPLNSAQYHLSPSEGRPRIVICPNGHRP